MTPTYTYNATVTRVVDGDTVDLMVDLGFRVTTKIRTRLLGINAPEVSTPEGCVSRDRLREHLPVGTEVVVSTFKDPTDKYGRWIATLVKKGSTESIESWMLGQDLAVRREY